MFFTKKIVDKCGTEFNITVPKLFLCVHSLRPRWALEEAEGLGDLVVPEDEGIQLNPFKGGLFLSWGRELVLVKGALNEI